MYQYSLIIELKCPGLYFPNKSLFRANLIYLCNERARKVPPFLWVSSRIRMAKRPVV